MVKRLQIFMIKKCLNQDVTILFQRQQSLILFLKKQKVLSTSALRRISDWITVMRNRKIIWKHGSFTQKSAYNLEVILNTKQIKTLGIIIYKYKVLSVLNGMNYLKLIFKLFCIRQRLTHFKLQRNKTENRPSFIQDTFTERLQLQMTVLHHIMYMYISKAGHSLYTCLDIFNQTPDLNQIIKTTCKFKLKLLKIKDLYIKI